MKQRGKDWRIWFPFPTRSKFLRDYNFTLFLNKKDCLCFCLKYLMILEKYLFGILQPHMFERCSCSNSVVQNSKWLENAWVENVKCFERNDLPLQNELTRENFLKILHKLPIEIANYGSLKRTLGISSQTFEAFIFYSSTKGKQRSNDLICIF